VLTLLNRLVPFSAHGEKLVAELLEYREVGFITLFFLCGVEHYIGKIAAIFRVCGWASKRRHLRLNLP